MLKSFILTVLKVLCFAVLGVFFLLAMATGKE